jgi:putative ABC transport system permease protein
MLSIEALLRDVRQAWRLLLGNQGFASAALITIALGVGGTSAVFSVVYGVLLRPLPYADAERLVRVWEVHPGANAPFGQARLTRPAYLAWARSSGSLEDFASYSVGDFTVSGVDGAERLRGTRVTASLFRLLRVAPIAGRAFTERDVEPGAQPVVVLAHSSWRDRFGGDPGAIGKTLTIDAVDHLVIGIAPQDFTVPASDTNQSARRRDIAFYKAFAVPESDPGSAVGTLTAIARLRPGATIAQAEAEGTAIARSVDRPFADLSFGRGGPVEVRVRSIVDQMTMEVRPALVVMAAAIALVLLVACANVANLFLSRGSDRAREVAVRAALGADRRRLLRQFVTEGLVISCIGGALGALLGWALTAAVPAVAPSGFPRVDAIRVDSWFLFAAALSAVLVGTLSGLVPALKSSRVDLAATMQAGGARSTGSPGRRLRRMLLVIEAALAVVLLVGATLLARSFVALVRVDAGYAPDNVLTADVFLPREPGGSLRPLRLVTSTVERLRSVPGVRAAGAGTLAPFGGTLGNTGFALPGMAAADGKPVIAQALQGIVTPGYAEALGMRLVEGRFFRDEDSSSPIIAMLVNETFVKTYLTDGKPVTGRRFTGIFPRILKRTDAVVHIVGVVKDMLIADLDGRAQPHIYVPPGVGFHLGYATLVVRTNGDPAAITPIVSSIVRQLEPGAVVDRVGPLSAKIATSVSEPRFTAFVLGAFALFALALATTGLYGVMSYTVAERRREIGVRAALGATRGDVVRMVLAEGLSVTAIGLAIGLGVAALSTRALSAVLFGVSPLDTAAFSAAPVLMLVVACVACLIPARRAAAIDPAEALRAS